MSKTDDRLGALTAKLDRISMAQPGSSSDPPRVPTRSAASASAPQHTDEDAGIAALVFFPMEAGKTMLKTHYMQVLSEFATEEARARPKPHIGKLASTFGVGFERKSHDEDVVAAFKLEGHEVKNRPQVRCFRWVPR